MAITFAVVAVACWALWADNVRLRAEIEEARHAMTAYERALQREFDACTKALQTQEAARIEAERLKTRLLELLRERGETP